MLSPSIIIINPLQIKMQLEEEGWQEGVLPRAEELTTQHLLDLRDYDHQALFKGTKYPWEALARLQQYLRTIIQAVPVQQRNKGTTIGSVYVDDDVLIGAGTVLEHGAVIRGPAIIGNNCELRKGAYIRGNVVIGEGTIIGNSSEVKHSIIFSQVQISHLNYVGDSILSNKSHLAAGSIISNLKLDQSPVFVSFQQCKISTTLTKFGAILGQSCQIGCNAVLNPGSIIGKQSVVYPSVVFRGYLPPNHICKLQQSQTVVVRQ